MDLMNPRIDQWKLQDTTLQMILWFDSYVNIVHSFSSPRSGFVLKSLRAYLMY